MSFASNVAASLLRSPHSRSGLLAPLHVLRRSSLPLLTTGGVVPPRSSPLTSTSVVRCNAISQDDTHNCPSTLNGNHDPLHNDTQRDATDHKISDKIRELVELIRSMLQSMDDGEISVSPYDTAWVALVEDISGGGTPQFPSALDWISSNQLDDGSWGTEKPS
ncbi:Kolavenyl diphosphate synthase TPS5, chloroplastic [Sesamum angolense]|uniref:Kolavenyl diphosphate synthase TPS5, chloroplastic n=1 Tax=Sesamum angolense TaxID=2727404 RepID=A0AAE1XA36_9LAMI|nr:Kolavenyl diphosphate synthase TPS5, chloroplastic [Sesamum angolense]